MTRRGRLNGFTLLEFVVVLAIVAIAASLLLPAVEMTRASARKSACSNNMRQLVLAAHLYADAYAGALPGTASVRWTGACQVPQGGWQWHASVLPFVGEDAVYNTINWSFSAYDRRVNRTAVQAHVDAFLCPADYGGRSSYAVNAGTWYDYDYAVTGRGRWDGFSRHHLQAGAPRGSLSVAVMGPNIDAIPDGTSNSVLFAEQMHTPVVSGMGPTTAQTFFDPGMELRLLSPDQARRICLGKRDDPGKYTYRHPRSKTIKGTGPLTAQSFPAVGEYWAVPFPNRSTFVNGLLPPNSMNCLGRELGSKNGRDAAFGLRASSSWHKGGVNLGYADGSVRFVSDEVDQVSYTGRFSMDRGEVTMDCGHI